MVTKQEVKKWLDLHPQYKKRSSLYLATLAFTEDKVGSGRWHPGHIEVAIHAHRRMQEIVPNDEIGEKLEKKWRKDNGMQSGVEIAEEVREGLVKVNNQWFRIKS